MHFVSLAAVAVLVSSQGAIWRPVTGQTLHAPEETLYSSRIGSVGVKQKTQAESDRCHIRDGHVITFSLACASEQRTGINSSL